MPSCTFQYCHNTSGTTSGITFHRFDSRSNENREAWIEIVRRNREDDTWSPSKNTYICSAHFRDEDFKYSKKGTKFLKNNAIPLVSLHSSRHSEPAVRAAKHNKDNLLTAERNSKVLHVTTGLGSCSKSRIPASERTKGCKDRLSAPHDVKINFNPIIESPPPRCANKRQKRSSRCIGSATDDANVDKNYLTSAVGDQVDSSSAKQDSASIAELKDALTKEIIAKQLLIEQNEILTNQNKILRAENEKLTEALKTRKRDRMSTEIEIGKQKNRSLHIDKKRKYY